MQCWKFEIFLTLHIFLPITQSQPTGLPCTLKEKILFELSITHFTDPLQKYNPCLKRELPALFLFRKWRYYKNTLLCIKKKLIYLWNLKKALIPFLNDLCHATHGTLAPHSAPLGPGSLRAGGHTTAPDTLLLYRRHQTSPAGNLTPEHSLSDVRHLKFVWSLLYLTYLSVLLFTKTVVGETWTCLYFCLTFNKMNKCIIYQFGCNSGQMFCHF